jgi:hypothetical protein
VSVRRFDGANPMKMKTHSNHFPFARSARNAQWPTDIPHTERMRWKDSPRNFSAVWAVPAGVGFDELHIKLPRHFLVLAVSSGAIRISHGARVVFLTKGQAVAVSFREVQVEVPISPYGESVFMVHLISRMPTVEQLGPETLLGTLVGKEGKQASQVPGLFPYPNAGPLLQPALPGGKEIDSALELLWRLYVCGLQSTVRFVASGIAVWKAREISGELDPSRAGHARRISPTSLNPGCGGRACFLLASRR